MKLWGEGYERAEIYHNEEEEDNEPIMLLGFKWAEHKESFTDVLYHQILLVQPW